MPEHRRSCSCGRGLSHAGIPLAGVVVVALGLSLAEPVAAAEPALARPSKTSECAQCAIEDRRREAHEDQVEVTARYLGLEARWLDGRRTQLRCTRDREVWGVLRFRFEGQGRWRAWWGGPRQQENMALALPCPELSRSDYAKLYRYDPDDRQRDGLGHAPILQRGKVYRLTLVGDPDGIADDPTRPGGDKRVLALVAVNPPLPMVP